MQLKSLPYYTSGEIVKGFGRGSKELGIPTANLAREVIQNLPEEFDTGVYFGWACVNNGEVYKMVMSVGWNPFFENKEKSMEVYIIHEFDSDFYGEILKICILGYIRPERDFVSLEALIETINQDTQIAIDSLDKPEYLEYRSCDFFKADK